MATVAHTIYSHYDPEDRELLELETGQLVEQVTDNAEIWRFEASQIAQLHHPPPPRFVPATLQYDDWGSAVAGPSTLKDESSSLGKSLAGWYRTLTGDTSVKSAGGEGRDAISTLQKVRTQSQGAFEKRNKNNWFIMRAIRSDPVSTSSTPPPTLADILARDPPPLPTQAKYTPPVWLEIGPSNKGFAMLQRSGWNEGEALGSDVVRRRPIQDALELDDILRSNGKEKARDVPRQLVTCRKLVETNRPERAGASRYVDVIDLTLSDSDSEVPSLDGVVDNSTSPNDHMLPKVEEDLPGSIDNSALTDASCDVEIYDRRALLTPIATVLKSDRLGIGLKAKTVGPYKASQKRVTHNAAALAAHIRTSKEIQRRKRDHGRGRRGFERHQKKEEGNRKALLAYLNS